MTLGERCDEILRLIDETLGSFAPEGNVAAGDGLVPATSGGSGALTSSSGTVVAPARRRRGAIAS